MENAILEETFVIAPEKVETPPKMALTEKLEATLSLCYCPSDVDCESPTLENPAGYSVYLSSLLFATCLRDRSKKQNAQRSFNRAKKLIQQGNYRVEYTPGELGSKGFELVFTR